MLTFAYTWAKSTDSKSAAAGIGASGFNGWQGFLNNHDPERDYGLSDFDVDHRLVGSFVYNLPFGSGEKFAGDATGVKNAVVGGWQVNGIYTWQRGFPITIQAADLGGLNDAFGTNRADLVGDPNVDEPDDHAVVQHGGVRAAGGGHARHVRPEHLRGPGVNNLDLALFKNFELREGHAPAVPAGVVQRAQPYAVQRRLDQPDLDELRRGHVGAAARINQLGLKLMF